MITSCVSNRGTPEDTGSAKVVVQALSPLDAYSVTVAVSGGNLPSPRTVGSRFGIASVPAYHTSACALNSDTRPHDHLSPFATIHEEDRSLHTAAGSECRCPEILANLSARGSFLQHEPSPTRTRQPSGQREPVERRGPSRQT